MERLCYLMVFTLLLMAAPVFAEVMDKEMSVPEIWQTFAWGLLIAFITASIMRWFLVLSFCFGIVGLGFTWTEWFNSSVGPAMRAEAGEIYGVHINTALSLLFLAHIALWFVSTRISLIRLLRSWVIAPERETRHTLVFAVVLWTFALVVTFSGFGATAWIWLSPPFLIVTLFLVTAMIFYFRGSTRRVAVV